MQNFGLKEERILYMRNTKNTLFIAITLIFFLLNLSILFSLNLKKVSDKFLFNTFVIADLQKDVSINTKQNIEEELLRRHEVSFVKYISKEESFKNLQHELNISIPKASNPLTDSIIIYLKDSIYSDDIQNFLEAKSEVKEVYKNSNFIDKKEDKGLFFSFLQIVSLFIAISLVIAAIIIFKAVTAIEYAKSVFLGENQKNLLRVSKIRNILFFLSSSIIGTLVFFNLYAVFRKYIFLSEHKHILLTFQEIYIYHILVIAIVNLIIWIFPASLAKKSTNMGEINE